LHHHRFRDFQEFFGTVPGIFGVAFVRALRRRRTARVRLRVVVVARVVDLRCNSMDGELELFAIVNKSNWTSVSIPLSNIE